MQATGPVATTLSKSGVNLYALGATGTSAPCVVALASHYDSKVVPNVDYVGANDGGSSSVTLLHQIAFLKTQSASALGLTCDVIGVWFDGEEAVLFNWEDGQTVHPAHIQDNTYGSRYAAARLTSCQLDGTAAKCLPAALGGKPLVAVVLMDMIGSKDLHISRDGDSTPALTTLAADGAAALGTPGVYDKLSHAVEDDHIPYRQAGVLVLDLIDFNNLDYWHAAGDDTSHVSYDSMDQAGRIALYVALQVAKDPAAYRK
jgi:Zn-dependent M28 family amino/carboxypeptidase